MTSEEPRTPTGRLLLGVWQEHNHYVHGRRDEQLPEQFAQIEREAALAAPGAAALREALQRRHNAHPDDSHGDGWFNVGIRSALAAVNEVFGDVDQDRPCEGAPWCAAHHGWRGDSRKWCDLAQHPWTWATGGHASAVRDT